MAEWLFNDHIGNKQLVLDRSGHGNDLQLGPSGGNPTRQGAYMDFGGADDYCRLQAADIQQGVLSYLGNDTTTAEFRDTSQDFSEWQTIVGNAKYMLTVINNDITTSWGYMGTANNGAGVNDDIDIYTDVGLVVRGWKGILPVTGGKTVSTYEVIKTDFQITAETTAGCWFINSGRWHFVVNVLSAAGRMVYLDGILKSSNATPVTLSETGDPMLIGAEVHNGLPSNGNIAYACVYSRVLTAAEITQLYQTTQFELRRNGVNIT